MFMKDSQAQAGTHWGSRTSTVTLGHPYGMSEIRAGGMSTAAFLERA
jgi:hypothetical protein